MQLARSVVAYVLFSSLCMAQTVVGLTASGTETTLNRKFLAERPVGANPTRTAASTSIHTDGGGNKNVVVFPGDRVFAQFVDGASWQTSIYLVNLENHPTSFSVLFLRDDGSDLYVPVVGQGLVRGMDITLDTAGSYEFETSGNSPNLAQGWALISQTTNDSVGGMAVFRQRFPGFQAQEAVVPVVSQFDSHFVLLFDNTNAYVTGIAIANPTNNSVVIPVNIRNQSGQIIDQRTISLGPYGHTAFVLTDFWSSTAGRQGAIEFLTSGFGVGALGLRANGAALTSFNVLENLNWRAP